MTGAALPTPISIVITVEPSVASVVVELDEASGLFGIHLAQHPRAVVLLGSEAALMLAQRLVAAVRQAGLPPLA
jgi:hypothetical protein